MLAIIRCLQYQSWGLGVMLIMSPRKKGMKKARETVFTSLSHIRSGSVSGLIFLYISYLYLICNEHVCLVVFQFKYKNHPGIEFKGVHAAV